ncbi:MAG: hypothetical protein N2517_07300 [Ignavibacteria bacterium]|nr:hypothetical protein [Ignavibacteria bacterium]
MKVLKVKEVKDCFESNNSCDFLLSGPITKEFAEYLGKLGKFLYFDEFDVPAFKVIVRGEYTVKGAIGKKTIRILLPEDVSNYPLDNLINYINQYKQK